MEPFIIANSIDWVPYAAGATFSFVTRDAWKKNSAFGLHSRAPSKASRTQTWMEEVELTVQVSPSHF